MASFGLWASELAYAETLIAADVRNNSAWSQRWFVVHGAPGTCAAPLHTCCLCDLYVCF